MSFKFECPACGQRMEVEEDWSGLQCECPNCGGTVTIPSVPGTEQVEPQILCIPPQEEQPIRAEMRQKACKPVYGRLSLALIPLIPLSLYFIVGYSTPFFYEKLFDSEDWLTEEWLMVSHILLFFPPIKISAVSLIAAFITVVVIVGMSILGLTFSIISFKRGEKSDCNNIASVIHFVLLFLSLLLVMFVVFAPE